MKKKVLLTVALASLATSYKAQIKFPVEIQPDWTAKTIWFPKSPLKSQPIFIGGVDTIQTTTTYGNAAGTALAKQWHDFIAFKKDVSKSETSGWVIVNHEMIQANSKIGDGGGMTMFKIEKNADSTLKVVPQTLTDGRSGKFFNVDFANTTGETGMNCGGINTPEGRIWTAEEWMQSSNAGINSNGTGFKDTTDFTIGVTTPAGFPGFNGRTIKRFQNLNWFVEIDPQNAKAVRKQYNWGRAGWEGGVVMPDQKTVYMFEDGSPGILGKFVATTANDFTSGQLYVYKHDAPTKWIAIENNLDTLIELNTVAVRRGATMFNRLEWGQIANGKIYIAETGRDAFSFKSGNSLNGVISPTLVEGYKTRYKIVKGVNFPGTDAAAADSVRQGKFADYYGRVIEFDPATNEVRSFLEGGPLASGSTSDYITGNYPVRHLSNPDGIDVFNIGTKSYLIIQEDLNGTSYNRMPNGLTKTICETYLLDLSIANPTLDDLIRITACSPGAEITGGKQIDENTILFNAQHPDVNNTYPYNNSLTYAITGFNQSLLEQPELNANAGFTVYPNPASRELHLSEEMDVAIYNSLGSRVAVLRDVTVINVENFTSGVYYIQSEAGELVKFIVE
jgi:secreted PhoX family phosphatase